VLRGESPARIAFLRRLIEEGPAVGLEPVDWGGTYERDSTVVEGAAKGDEYALFYFGRNQVDEHTFRLSGSGAYRAEIIDGRRLGVVGGSREVGEDGLEAPAC
jgi:hypothetical protein